MHAGLAHGIYAIFTVNDRLDLPLFEVGHDVYQGALPLRQAYDAGALAATERSEGQLFNVVVLIQAGGLESLLQLLQLRRKHTRLQIHRSGRVLHGVIVDHDQLLNIFRDCGACVLTKLRSCSR